MKTVETPQLHALYSFLDKVVDMPVVFNDKCLWLSVQKTAKVPQLHCSFKWPMSLLCRSCWCRRCFCGRQRLCDHTATSSSLSAVEVPQIQFTV